MVLQYESRGKSCWSSKKKFEEKKGQEKNDVEINIRGQF